MPTKRLLLVLMVAAGLTIAISCGDQRYPEPTPRTDGGVSDGGTGGSGGGYGGGGGRGPYGPY